MRSRELVNSPQVLQSATGRQSAVTAGSLTDPKPGHLLLKSSAHKAHSRSPPTVPGPAQLPFPPESPHQSIQTPRSVLLPFSTLPRSTRAGRLLQKKESSETKAGGEEGWACPHSCSLPAGSEWGSGRAGWVACGEPKTGLLSWFGPWLAVLPAATLWADQGPAVVSTSSRGQAPPLPSCHV